MKLKTFVYCLAVLIVLAIVAVAYLQGRTDVWKNEFKECEANMLEMTQWQTNLPPELKEYAKARYYYLANKVPKGFVGRPKDFGPISTNMAHLAAFKGPTSGNAEYEAFLQRFNLLKSTP